MESYQRPSWDEYFIEVMDAIAKRATCGRGRSGCVIARDNQLLVTGYVGSPVGLPHCDEVGHQMKKVIHVDEGNKETEHCVRTVHAEQNAILYAAKNNVSLEGATIYVTLSPCVACSKVLFSLGIKKVYYLNSYAEYKGIPNDEGVDFLKKFGVDVERYILNNN